MTPTPEIRSASDFSASNLKDAMVDAFSDYAIPMQLSQEAFDLMMRQRGLDLAASRVAVVKDDVAAIWLTSIRSGRGYLISSGTRPAFRGQGLARAMAEDCLTYLRKRGVTSYQTEVLRNNETALGLYLSLGMAKHRRLDCYRLSSGARVPAEGRKLRRVAWDDFQDEISALRDWSPSWQNSDQAVSAISERVTCLAYYDGQTPVAYIVLSAESGTVYQLAVRNSHRRRGLALSLLRAAQDVAGEVDLRLINVSSEDDGFRALMKRAGADETIGQYELLMPL